MTTRKLTDGETALCRKIFGTAIDYDRVRVHAGVFMRFQPQNCSMAPNGQLYMAGNYKNDYAATDAFWRSHFIHEMTHVWQYQNKVLNPIIAAAQITLAHNFNYSAGYDYRLEHGKDLTAYNMEQQACIVQDYYRITVEQDDRHSGRCQNECAISDRLPLYHAVLKNFLNNPGYKTQPKPPQP